MKNKHPTTIKNKLNSTTLQLVTATGVVVSDNVGNYNPSLGVVSIEGLNPSAFVSSEVKLFVTPANESTIRPLLMMLLNYSIC